MRTMLRAVALAAALPLVAPIASAQVTFLLSHTGQLQLTDQQVVKLAAIARREADRHKAMRASFDSLHMQFRRGEDSGGMRQIRGTMERERDANHADLRDAIAVLTPDQQATAWELVSRPHPRMLMRHRGPGRDGPVMRMRTGSIQDDDGNEVFVGPGPDDDQ